MKSLIANTRFLNDAALQAAANRSEAIQVLCNLKDRISGKLRRALIFLIGRQVPVQRCQTKHPMLRMEQQLRGKSARQLITMRRREIQNIRGEQGRVAAQLKQIIDGTAPEPRLLRYFEWRLQMIEIEMRRRGILTGD